MRGLGSYFYHRIARGSLPEGNKAATSMKMLKIKW